MPMKWAKHIAMKNLYEQEQKATTPDTVMVTDKAVMVGKASQEAVVTDKAVMVGKASQEAVVTDKAVMVGKASQTVMVADKAVMVGKTTQQLQEQLNEVCHLGTTIAM